MLRSLPRAWSALRISQHGEYSMERWHALQLYRQHTSIARAITVCVFTPLPALAFVVAIEAALPLEPVAHGYYATMNLWIRFSATSFTLAFCWVILTRRFIPELRVPTIHLIASSAITSACHTAFTMGLAAEWVYPIPFTTVVTSPVFTAVCMGSFLALLGKRRPLEKMKLYMAILTILNMLNFAYPAYGAFYRTQQASVQMVIVVLPLALKMVAKAIVARLCRALHCDAFTPEVSHFSVELLHALFVTSCVQTTTEPLRVTLVLLVFDFVPLIGAYQSVAKLAKGTNKTIHHVATAQGPASRIHPTGMPNELSTSGNPTIAVVAMGLEPTSRSMLRALYACENYLLVEYIECVIPLVYAVYVAALYHLPNAQYYEVMLSMQASGRLGAFLANTGLLVSLQVLSAIVFSFKISRLRELQRLSCLHMLSFVLETQQSMVQAWLFFWMPLCLQSVVAHGGMDFTLRFEWMRQPKPTVLA